MILFSACDIQIIEGQLRFRRVFVWRSVPLESITRVKALQAPAAYIRVDDGGKRYRLVFYPGDFEESSPPPVIRFLEEACARNREKSDSHTCDMATETGRRGFTYESPLGGIFFLWACGILLMSFRCRRSSTVGNTRALGITPIPGPSVSARMDVRLRDSDRRFRRAYTRRRTPFSPSFPRQQISSPELNHSGATHMVPTFGLRKG